MDSNQCQAAHALALDIAPLLSEADMPWVFDLYFKHCRLRDRACLSFLFALMPKEKTIVAINSYLIKNPDRHRDVRFALEAIDHADKYPVNLDLIRNNSK
jgi:hypothetical protein